MATANTIALAEKFRRDHGPEAHAAKMRAAIAECRSGGPMSDRIRSYSIAGRPVFLVDVTADDRSTP